MTRAWFLKAIGFFAGVVGLFQIADVLGRLVLFGELGVLPPGPGPLLLAAVIAALRELRRYMQQRQRPIGTLRPNGQL
jgi:hypothetical protein